MLFLWNRLREKYFEKMSVEDRFTFNDINNCVRIIWTDPEYDEMRKQELIKPLLYETIDLCKKARGWTN
jgi:hypothetical protein